MLTKFYDNIGLKSPETLKKDKQENLKRKLRTIPILLSIISLGGVIFGSGFEQTEMMQNILNWLFILTLWVGLISDILRYFSLNERPRIKVWFFDSFFLLLLVITIFNWFYFEDQQPSGRLYLTYLVLILIFIREFSAQRIDFKRKFVTPAQLFIASFIFIILSGTLLLMLPKATNTGISFINALFTCTSAVCVTGLSVVDSGTYFTTFGQILIIILMQAGGLGILTFTSYFSYFFKGESTYDNQLLMKDMINSQKITEIFVTLKRIIIVTFIIEAIGAILIYISIDETVVSNNLNRIFFSIFHSISGFCNAGFSTLPNNLYEPSVRFNYFLHIIVAFLIILGGLGFPIVFNAIGYSKHLLINRFIPLITGKEQKHKPWVININSRIVLITTGILLFGGTLLFYIFEYHNTLAEHSGFGKIITAFFGATTPRTAGFNTVDTAAMNFYTIMLIFFLMWVGASPASTGGGIKTSTFAISILNIISIARGKNRIEIYRREISDDSGRRSFATIALSAMVLGLSIIFISYFDGDKDLKAIAFESFSALGTVGLSLGITAKLSTASKFIIVLTMFIGRVGMLTILIAILNNIKHLKYRYPTEDILIN